MGFPTDAILRHEGAQAQAVLVRGHAPHWAASQHEIPLLQQVSALSRYRHDPYTLPPSPARCHTFAASLPAGSLRGGSVCVGAWRTVHVEQLHGYLSSYPLTYQHFPAARALVDVSGTKIPARKVEIIAETHGMFATEITKLAIGQVPYHVPREQLAQLLADVSGREVLALEARLEASSYGGLPRHTGLWFAFVRTQDVFAFRDIDRRLLIRHRDAVLFGHDEAHVLRSWCEAKRAAVRAENGNAATAPLLPVTVGASRVSPSNASPVSHSFPRASF